MILILFWAIEGLNDRFITNSDMPAMCDMPASDSYVWIGLTATLWLFEKLKKSAKNHEKSCFGARTVDETLII